MRITNSMMSDQFLTDANDSLNRLAKAQQQVDSTKRISSIDDDPLATMSSLKARNKLSSLAEYQSSISTANSSLKENSTQLDSLNTVLQSAYELMSSANSGTKGESDLKAIRDEMANLRDEVLSISNSSLGTRYLFSGDSSAKPFSVGADGNLSYNGIDLTKFALRDEVLTQTAGTESAYQKIDTVQDSETQSTLAMISDTNTTDYQMKNTLVPRVLTALDSMIQSGKTALYAANKFGTDVTAQASALKTSIDTLSNLRTALDSANGKETGITSQLTAAQAELTELQKNPANNADAIAAKQQEITTLTEKKVNEYSTEEIRNILSDGTGGLSAAFNAAKTALSGVSDTMNTSISSNGGAAGKNLGVESDAVRTIRIGTAQTVKTSLNGLELMGVSVKQTKDPATGKTTSADTNQSNATNLYYILDKCVGVLNGDLDKSLMGSMVTTLQSAQSQVLSLNTDVGTSQNRMSMISDRYVASKVNYSGMLSDAEDADMAEAAVTLTTAKTVYNAALAAGAKIVQTSLVDFLR
jgi:flagellar hook-associated protein 3 FlgL